MNKMKKINLLLAAIAMVSFISLNSCGGQGATEENGEATEDTVEVAKQETEAMEKKVDTAAVMEEETDTTEADTASME